MAKKTPTIEIDETSEGKTYWRLRAKNGEIICTSESYDTDGSAFKTANKLGKIASSAKVVDVRRQVAVEQEPVA